MTAHRDFKNRVRARMAKTGESYCTARVHVMSERERMLGPRRGPGTSPLKPIRSIGSPLLRIEPDARFELVSVLARLARLGDYSSIRPNAYVRDVDATFGAFRKHPAVHNLLRLEQERGFHYGYLIDLATKLIDTRTLNERMPCAPPVWDQFALWNTDDARALATDLRDFAERSNWAEFLGRWQESYQQAAQRLEGVLDLGPLETWLDDYLGTRGKTRFTLTPAFLMDQQTYSTIIESTEQPEEHFVFLGTSVGADERGIPQFDENTVQVVAEMFFLLRTNAEVSIHDAVLRPATKTVCELVDPKLYENYQSWHDALAQSLRHAIGAHFLSLTQGPEAATRWIERFMPEFFWLERLSVAFNEYAADRARYPRLREFMPRIVAFFEELGANIDVARFRQQQQANRQLQSAHSPRIVAFDPPDGAKGVEPGPIELKITFDRGMSARKSLVRMPDGNFPELADWEHFDETRTVLTIPAQLEPATNYALSFNAERHVGFRDQAGNPLMPTPYRFTTRADPID